MPQTETARRLTVVQVLPALESGGVERGTLEIGKYLAENGHRSIVISNGGRMVAQLEREGSEHVTWDIGHKSLWTLHLIPRLRHLLREEKVDILHARSRMPAWICHLAWKGMDVNKRPRFITTVHGMYSVNAYSAIMTKGEKVIAVSDTVRDYILKNYPGVYAERIITIPRGIDPGSFPHGFTPSAEWLSVWRTQFPQLLGKKVLTLPGRITRLKGHEDFIGLIDCLKRNGEPVHGLIVGGAEIKKRPYLAELQERVVRWDLTGDITFTGQRNDLREIMAVSDIVLSLSTKPESFGRTVMEALSIGIPVVGYDHGGVGEQLRRVYPQGCVPLGNIDELLRACRSIPTATRIAPKCRPTTLLDMETATLSVYRSFWE